MNASSMIDLYASELQDLYNAEKQLTKALPKLAKAASSEALASALRSHLDETQGHLRRLETILKGLNKKPGGEKCEAMQGLIAEGDEVAHANGDEAVRDAGIILAAQKVEHYEIAGYGTMCTFAKLLGRAADLKLLKEILAEEKAADSTLTDLAESEINWEAAAAS
jgi:ferritin-like metal-binding protein YciE